jgi:hypothetical protein
LTRPNRNYHRGQSPPGKAWCAGHRDFLPAEEFQKCRAALDGLGSYCRECLRARGSRSLAKHSNYRLHVDTARKRGLQELSRDEHRAITSAKCTYGNGCRPEIFVGVDRIDSTRGYPGNSQPCCSFHNNLKGIMDDDLFRIFVKRHPEHRACSNSRVIHKSRRKQAPITLPPKPAKRQVPMPLFDNLQTAG